MAHLLSVHVKCCTCYIKKNTRKHKMDENFLLYQGQDCMEGCALAPNLGLHVRHMYMYFYVVEKMQKCAKIKTSKL